MVEVLRAAALACAIVCSSAAVASATAGSPAQRIDVFPGPNALADALSQAQPGDVLALHTGTFPGTVTVSTPDLTLEPAGDGPVAIDGACSGIATVDVRADGVAFQGPMTVAGGLFYELNYLGQRSGVVDGLTIMDTCHGSFGILLQDTGGVRVAHSTIEGFAGGGIEVVGPGPAGARPLGLSSNEISGVGRGILVQNANGVDVETNRVHDNTFSGITVEGSQRVLIRGNAALRDGDEGISLDAASTDDRVVGNVALGNTVDLSNAGQGNCFLRNRFQTSQGDIGC